MDTRVGARLTRDPDGRLVSHARACVRACMHACVRWSVVLSGNRGNFPVASKYSDRFAFALARGLDGSSAALSLIRARRETRRSILQSPRMNSAYVRKRG